MAHCPCPSVTEPGAGSEGSWELLRGLAALGGGGKGAGEELGPQGHSRGFWGRGVAVLWRFAECCRASAGVCRGGAQGSAPGLDAPPGSMLSVATSGISAG